MTRATLYELMVSAMNSISRIDKRCCAPGLVLLLCCAGFIVRSRSSLKVESVNARAHVSAPSALPALARARSQGTPDEPARVVKFNLFAEGIYPREVHVKEGLLAITIEDYSGGTTGLVVERETGNAPERAGRVARDGPHWRGRSEMKLGPGRYHVYMADRPANRALLVVEP